jgi:anti-sigma factor RsiW
LEENRMHHGEMLDSYLAGQLDGGRLAAAEAHVSNCLHCTRTIAEIGVKAGHWERRGWLDRLVRVDAPAVEALPVESIAPSPALTA